MGNPLSGLRACNWIHLDLKGSIPPLPSLLAQLSLMRSAGFNGVVFEYEDRLDWRSWPGLGRQAFTREEHARLLGHCAALGMEVVPLIQTLGHLEWLLKHEEYGSYREDGSFSEICPSAPGIGERLCRWISEVLEMHPGCRFLHIGGDEPFHLGTCPVCRAAAASSPDGRMSIYLGHIGALCRFIISRNVRPIIWADRFARKGAVSLLRKLPEETVLVEWGYSHCPGLRHLRSRMRTGHEVMGCCGISTGYFGHCYHVQERLTERYDNIRRWREICCRLGIGRLNAVWGRGAGLWEIYSPWIGHWPAVLFAGDEGSWGSHPWRSFFRRMDHAVLRDDPGELQRFAAEVTGLPAANQPERECLRYWRLALGYQRIVALTRMEHSQLCMLNDIRPFIGQDPWLMEQRRKQMGILREELERWRLDAEGFFRETGWSDGREFIGGRCAYVHRFLI